MHCDMILTQKPHGASIARNTFCGVACVVRSVAREGTARERPGNAPGTRSSLHPLHCNGRWYIGTNIPICWCDSLLVRRGGAVHWAGVAAKSGQRRLDAALLHTPPARSNGSWYIGTNMPISWCDSLLVRRGGAVHCAGAAAKSGQRTLDAALLHTPPARSNGSWYIGTNIPISWCDSLSVRRGGLVFVPARP